mgnify:CR=1 FL=1
MALACFRLAMAVSLSSTVIIVKILYDKFELDTLPGRITLGVLVLQDLFAVLFLAIQPSLNDLQLSAVFLSIVRVGALVAAIREVQRFFGWPARAPQMDPALLRRGRSAGFAAGC